MKNILRRHLSGKLQLLGYLICRHPLCFIFGPLIATAIFGIGLLRMEYIRDFEKLIVNENGRAMQNKKLIESLFPLNTSDSFDIIRITSPVDVVQVIMINKYSGNVLKEDCLKDVERMDTIIKSITIEHQNKSMGYRELCAKNDGRCYRNPIEHLFPMRKQIIDGRYKINYPLEFSILPFVFRPYLANLGGVTVDESGFVKEAQAFRLVYFTDTSNLSKEVAIHKWVDTVICNLTQTDFSSMTVLPCSLSVIIEELKQVADSVLPLTAAVVIAVSLFSFITCMTTDSVTSKPWLGVMACISAGLAVISSFGLMFHFGVPTTDFNLSIMFLILGTEVDDAYVLIAAWRRTSSANSVEKRLGDTFSEAGVSITITSATNVIAFSIGSMTPFIAVQNFCIHSALALFFTYLYMITFFGGCMAIDGFREKKLMHAITFRKCSDKGIQFGIKQEKNELNEDTRRNVFRDVIGEHLTKNPIKLIVIITFVGNLGLGAWGLTYLEQGLEFAESTPSGSITSRQFEAFYKYFPNFTHALHIAINQPLNYADVNVQKSVESMIEKFQSHPNVEGTELTISWLYYYKVFQNHPAARFLLRGFNLTDEQGFIDGLRYAFLRLYSGKSFKNDILFNNNYTKILSSRFVIPLKNLSNRKIENEVISQLWDIADESELPIIIHSTFFPLMEQGVIIKDIVIKLTWITALLIILIFFLFIPNLTTALVISVVVISTIVETLGYMFLWDVRLDVVSTTILILSVGFSLNYPSHVTFAFTIPGDKSPNDRIKESLNHVGLPIVQGSLSTILGASVLAPAGNYPCITFVKLLFLIATLTAYHAMFVLPVVLSLLSQLLKTKGTLTLNNSQVK